MIVLEGIYGRDGRWPGVQAVFQLFAREEEKPFGAPADRADNGGLDGFEMFDNIAVGCRCGTAARQPRESVGLEKPHQKD
ncbi:hypothetical protein NDR87_13585 [Nocardia sp. CDC159]|uniref:Uncharacterized protein n=1 Tax=Nocardia pulmonis TaxID=2951408 RepID=A0A9X2E675_9NOCA|nr:MULTISPECIES: hypothetical protein [Nocardia]MCM6774544.1 hypothetical protein [Nocardia pulmonis]MCM6787390.1 hypothetical protein [Nocardia sp. CDC159]